jgi:hypothetical protein
MNTATSQLHPQTKEALLALLRALPATDFANHLLLDRVPWLFSNRAQYVDWKGPLAAELKVDPYMIVIVGSAAVGFSLNPYKGFSPFGQSSDIDVAVISMWHFDIAWRWLRDLGPAKMLSRSQRGMFWKHRDGLVFDGAIATDQFLGQLSYGPEWSTALSRAGAREPTVGREVKVRVYRDFESLRAYQVRNIGTLKLELVAGEAEGDEGQLLDATDVEDDSNHEAEAR